MVEVLKLQLKNAKEGHALYFNETSKAYFQGQIQALEYALTLVKK